MVTCWDYGLTPDDDDATVITEVFDGGPEEVRPNLLREGREWVTGTDFGA